MALNELCVDEDCGPPDELVFGIVRVYPWGLGLS